MLNTVGLVLVPSGLVILVAKVAYLFIPAGVMIAIGAVSIGLSFLVHRRLAAAGPSRAAGLGSGRAS